MHENNSVSLGLFLSIYLKLTSSSSGLTGKALGEIGLTITAALLKSDFFGNYKAYDKYI